MYFSAYGGEQYHISMNIKTTGSYESTISATTTLTQTDIEEIDVKKTLTGLFDKLKENLLFHYNPDEEKNSGDSYWKFRASLIGKNLLKFYQKIRDKAGI